MWLYGYLKKKKKKNKFNLKKIYGVLISFFILGQGGFTASMTGQVYVYLCGTEDALWKQNISALFTKVLW